MSSPSSTRSPARPPPDGAQEAPPPDEFDTSFFPAPSPFFARYTSHNLSLPPDALISDVPGEPAPFLAKELEPPNVDWIVQEGSYSVFGETWPVEDKLPTLEEMGVQEMFDRNADRKQSLQTLLRAILVTYTQLLDSLLTPPPSLAHPRPPLPDGSAPPSDPERLTEHVRLIAINMHHLVNELRPVQARETLKTMMQAQIDRRRAKTAAIKQKCAEITSTLSTLHSDVLAASSAAAPTPPPAPSSHDPASPSQAENESSAIRRKLQALVDSLA
ncbi:hypothetical protein JCM5296_003766 [Sporobolomyces johnsonii]